MQRKTVSLPLRWRLSSLDRISWPYKEKLVSSSDVARYQQMTDAELYEELGRLLLGEEALGMGSLGRSRLRRFGRDKWNDTQRALRQRLCTEDGESRLGDGQVALGQGLVAAVAETLKFE